MTLSAVTTLGVGLSMDAFAVALGQGAAASPATRTAHALTLGLLFGFAQAAMPLLGWALGATFYGFFEVIDHWIAFFLLSLLGITMIRTGWQDEGEPPAMARGWKLGALALATSIDAAAAGITLTMLGMPILAACALIGLITFVLTVTGTLLGRAAGQQLGRMAEVVGGLILIALGVKILIEHQFLP